MDLFWCCQMMAVISLSHLGMLPTASASQIKAPFPQSFFSPKVLVCMLWVIPFPQLWILNSPPYLYSALYLILLLLFFTQLSGWAWLRPWKSIGKNWGGTFCLLRKHPLPKLMSQSRANRKRKGKNGIVRLETLRLWREVSNPLLGNHAAGLECL